MGGRTNDVRVLDLSRTNQDVGRGTDKLGIDHRRIEPSHTFRDDESNILGEVVVSERSALIFFVGRFDGTILSIESYDMTGQHVASTAQTIEAFGPGSQEDLVGVINGNHPHTTSVVTGEKLVVLYHTENRVVDDGTEHGFGLYVFDCRDLSFCTYVPLFRNHEVSFTRMSEDWLCYGVPGTRQYHALQITGGHVGRSTIFDLENFQGQDWIKGNYVYVCNQEDREGHIEMAQFDLRTGNKIRTLKTFVPWTFDDDGTAYLPFAGANNGTPQQLERIVVNVHVVGNKLAFVISSVGSHKNSIVTFALPPPPMS